MVPLMQFKSHIAGRNADVTLYQDRVEWSKPGRSWIGPAIAAVFTVGIALIWYRGSGRTTEIIPIRSINSVTSRQVGMGAAVSVITSGNTIDMRCSRAEGEEFQRRVMGLITTVA